jgi:GH25 family lysozyme M1 (1,4-beta-N-acetylmuramidase)
MSKKLIADISKHNESLNGKKMKDAGIQGVIIRVGYRSAGKGFVTQDIKYTQFIKEAVSNKIPVGVYWWTQSKSDAEAKEEANKCVKWIKDYKLSFPIFLDLEFYNSKKEGRADHLSAKKRTQYALAFIKQCNKLGYECGIYCNPDFWKANLIPSKLSNLPRWIAHYGKSSVVDCDIWQYTSTANGHKYGCGWKYIDLSYMYTDFVSGKKSKFSKETSVED